MTAAKVRPVLPLPGKDKGSTANNYVSSCSRCRLGIFKTQPHRWGTGRELGLVHDYDCIEGEST